MAAGEDEKALLRSFCFSQLSERDNRIATQIANVCSRVIRYDWPNSWPDALSSLLNSVAQYKSIDTGIVRISIRTHPYLSSGSLI